MDGPPPPVDDEHTFFAWYVDGGFQFDHIASWWEHRDDPNVLFVHYDDMKADLDGADATGRRVPRHPGRRGDRGPTRSRRARSRA